MRNILPSGAQELLHQTDIPSLETAVSDEVESVLLKLWQGKDLDPGELGLDITPAELAATWTITHRRPVRMDTARQMVRRRSEPIKPSRQWGSGPAVRRLYRLGDVLEVRIREKRTSDAAHS